MRKLLVFCSNLIDGGTAEMFVQCSLGLMENADTSYEVIPCVNKDNPVKVYSLIPNLTKLDVKSEVQVCGAYKVSHSICKKIIEKVKRSLKYSSIKKNNISLMKSFINDNKIDDVLIHNGGYIGDDLCNQMLQAAYESRRTDKRIIVFHGTANKRKIIDSLRFSIYDKRINRYATDIITGSNYSKQKLLKDTKLKNIHVVHNGISYDDCISDDEKKSNVNYKEADIHIVNVANFYETKGQFHLLQAFNEARKNVRKNIHLTLIGHPMDADFFNQCVNYINKNNLSECVTIAENIYDSREYMNLYNITIVSSLGGEDFPMVPLEAMRSGGPTIAYACNGIPEEIEDYKNGLLIEVGNIVELSKAISKLTEDDSLRNSLGEQCKIRYKNEFTRDAMTKRYINVLKGIV